MKKSLSIAITLSFLATSTWAADSVDHSAKASKHSVLASVETAATGASVASAVVAAPVVISGLAAGSIAQQSSKAARAIHQHHDKKRPLKITTKVITRDPPPSVVTVEQTIQH